MKVNIIVSFVIIAAMLVSFGIVPIQVSYANEENTTESASSSIEATFDYEISDPEIEKDSGTTKNVTFYRNGNPIKAKIMLPEGEGPFKTIVIVGGLYASLGFYSNKAQVFNENGYAVVEIRPTNNKMPPFYKEPEYLGDFVFEQMLDLSAVMDALKFFSQVDLSHIYLYGHSMGGLAAVYAGVLRQDAIKGIILVEPSFQYPENMAFENGQKLPADFYSFLSDCQVPVVIIQGTGERPDLHDFPHFYDKAIESLPKGEIIIIDGADHLMNGEYGEQMVDSVCGLINEW